MKASSVSDTNSTTLGEISAFITKGATPTTYGFAWEKKGVPFLRSECVSERGLDMRQSMFISAAANKALSRSRVTDGDILMTITGYVGRVVRLVDIGEANINQHIARIRIKDSRFDNDYVYHYLAQRRMREYYKSIVTGQAYPQVSLAQVRDTEIPALPIEKQRAIAAALDDAMDFITVLEKAIVKKQAIKQGMTQQLLTGKARLPSFSGSWRFERLSELLAYEQPGRYLVATSAHLKSGLYPVLTAGKTFILGYTNETDGVYRGRPAIIFDDFTTSSKYVDLDFKVQSSAIKILTPRRDINLRFMYELMQVLDFQLGDHKRYWISEYGRQTVQVPERPEQDAIASVLADADTEVNLLRQRLAKAKAIKQGMMQELLTGRTRLPVREAAA